MKTPPASMKAKRKTEVVILFQHPEEDDFHDKSSYEVLKLYNEPGNVAVATYTVNISYFGRERLRNICFSETT